MNIKVGDKIRIKTEEELLADGWELWSKVADESCFAKTKMHVCQWITLNLLQCNTPRLSGCEMNARRISNDTLRQSDNRTGRVQ